MKLKIIPDKKILGLHHPWMDDSRCLGCSKITAQAQLKACEKEATEILYNQTMQAKKSGWDDAEKFYKAQYQDKIDEMALLIEGYTEMAKLEVAREIFDLIKEMRSRFIKE